MSNHDSDLIYQLPCGLTSHVHHLYNQCVGIARCVTLGIHPSARPSLFFWLILWLGRSDCKHRSRRQCQVPRAVSIHNCRFSTSQRMGGPWPAPADRWQPQCTRSEPAYYPNIYRGRDLLRTRCPCCRRHLKLDVACLAKLYYVEECQFSRCLDSRRTRHRACSYETTMATLSKGSVLVRTEIIHITITRLRPRDWVSFVPGPRG